MNLADIEGTTPFAVCRLLSDLARLVPAGQSIVEIGVYKGRTLAHLADGARKGHGALVYGVDVFDLPVPPPGRHRVSDIHAREALRSTGLEDRVTIVKASSADAAAAFDGPPVGLLFLDGGHTREAVLADLRSWMRRFARIATVIFDDYDKPGVREAVFDAGLDVEVTEDGRIAITVIDTERNRIMTDNILVLRGRRKSELRKAFRAVQRDQGPGTIVAFTGAGVLPFVDATIRGLLETNSITEPMYDGQGRALVRILGEGEDSRTAEPVDLSGDDVDALVDPDFEPPEPEQPAVTGDRNPPPQAGPGSGVGAWRDYAAAVTGESSEVWAEKSRTQIIEELSARNVPVE